ncbi:MAG: hypothetical protein ACI9WC_001735, partial [Arenicella sp.]
DLSQIQYIPLIGEQATANILELFFRKIFSDALSCLTTRISDKLKTAKMSSV